MPAIWTFVTDFGDSAVTIPLALLTLGFLLATGERRIALAWAEGIGGCAVVIGALKLAFGACGSPDLTAAIVSPSGHTAMSTAVYGSLALLIGTNLPPSRRLLLHMTAAVAIVAIGLSRVALHDHTRAEIAIGFAVGAAAAALFGVMLRRQAAPELPLTWLLLSTAVVVAAMHGRRWMIEPAVKLLALDVRLALPWCR